MRALAVLAVLYLLIALVVGRGDLWHRFTTPAPLSLTTAACLVALDDAGQTYRAVHPGTGTGCEGIHRVGISTIAAIDLTRPAAMSCPLALSLNQFANNVVQPAAETHFGTPVATIAHLGGFACRGVRGNPAIPSQHAAGNALDIAAFELADGRSVDIGASWRADDPAGAFLNAVARGARRHFTTVLTPDFDAGHANHFHLGHRISETAMAELAKALPGTLYNSDEQRRTQPLAPAATGPTDGVGRRQYGPPGTFPDTGEF